MIGTSTDNPRGGLLGRVWGRLTGQREPDRTVEISGLDAEGRRTLPPPQLVDRLGVRTQPLERTELTVPFKEKDKAKSLGASWDSEQKTWFVPPGKSLEDFQQWIPENQIANGWTAKEAEQMFFDISEKVMDRVREDALSAAPEHFFEDEAEWESLDDDENGWDDLVDSDTHRHRSYERKMEAARQQTEDRTAFDRNLRTSGIFAAEVFGGMVSSDAVTYSRALDMTIQAVIRETGARDVGEVDQCETRAAELLDQVVERLDMLHEEVRESIARELNRDDDELER